MKKALLTLVLALMALTMSAQRFTDKLDRGLIGMKTSKGVFLSWRVQSDEYYEVTYNLYRNGTKIAEGLTTSNFTDNDGTMASRYQVAPVVRGVEKEKCKAIGPWGQDYLEINPKHDASLKSTYVPNDACCADVDGDGELEILLKYDNLSEITQSYPKNGPRINGADTKEYSLFECLKLDGTVLWWVNCGPNMGDFQNNEQNIVGYDWDQDGKAEAIFRAADGTTIHMADGSVYTVGDASLNYRGATGGGTNWFMHSGKEYLLYVNGATGKPYVDMEYPLKRLEDSENPNGLLSGGDYDGLVNSAWGDGYGHRSSKYFFGAPYLDGRKPSIFLGRGIYTRHKFITYDVDPATHQLKERWRWMNNHNGPWKGQGYHNYAIADVDMDGRDEIIWGSMVIDDNGLGLNTAGLGHGDAQHHGDFNPYSYGLEGFFCNEDNQGNNYRNLTTGKIFHLFERCGNDDGRAIAGNFCGTVPGAMAFSTREGTPLNCVTGKPDANLTKAGVGMNFRCYWDGDLLEETYNGGDNTVGSISKYGKDGAIKTLTGSLTNNSTKATPCYMGDILGDWREEFLVRTPDHKIRIYSTTTETPWRMQSLWYDHQYRNGMVWEPCGYNQPPHVSFFVGELEGITAAPPSLTMTGREEVKNGGTISGSGKDIITCETGDMTATVTDGASPTTYIDNTPSWVQGWAKSEVVVPNDPTRIQYEYYTHTLTGGAFTGAMNLVKQGAGTLILPNVTETYTGKTDVWEGTLSFNGTLENSPLWLNRFAKLNSVGGNFPKGIKMDYAAELNIGDETAASTVTTSDIKLGFGSIINIDVFSATDADKLVAESVEVETKDWKNGPEYLAPVVRIKACTADGKMPVGKYIILDAKNIIGDASAITLEGCDEDKKAALAIENGKITLTIEAMRDAQDIVWIGSENGNWDVDNTSNFSNNGEAVKFVTNDNVIFDDNAQSTSIIIKEPVYPASVTFRSNTKGFSVSGESIGGTGSLTKEGAATLNIKNQNTFTGGAFLNGGKTIVFFLANNSGTDIGSLGDVNSTITIRNGATLAVTKNLTTTQPIRIANSNEGYINVGSGYTLTASNIRGDMAQIHKTGAGALTTGGTFAATRLYIDEGTVNTLENGSTVVCPGTVVFNGTNVTLVDGCDIYSSATSNINFEVPEGKSGKLYLDGRCDYNGKLTGKGNLTVYARFVRNYLKGNWSDFEGTITPAYSKVGSYDPDFSWSNSYGLPKATLNLNSGVTFNAGAYNVEIGDLKGAGVVYGTGTITFGGKNNDCTYSGTFTGSPALAKKGNGKWTITKPIENIRSLAINGGDFILAPTAGGRGVADYTEATMVSKPLTVAIAGTMTGFGHISSLTVNNGGTVKVGKNATLRTGAIYTNGAVQTNQGSEISFFIADANNNASSRSWLEVTGNLTINGKVSVEIASSYAPQVGDAITLWNVTGNVNIANAQFDLPSLPAGMTWDVSGLNAKQGVIKVVAGSTAIRNANANGSRNRTHNLRGQQVPESQKGIVIRNGRKVIVK